MRHAVAWYREFAPCDALRADVYAFFSFLPVRPPMAPARPLLREVRFDDSSFCAPQFADGQVSLLFELGRTCDATGRWFADAASTRGTILGPLSAVGRTEGTERPEMVGVYFRPARADRFLHVPVGDLTDHTVGIEEVWRGSAALASELAELGELDRIQRLEALLLARLGIGRDGGRTLRVDTLAARAIQRCGRDTVERMAHEAGVSRQHLSRAFRERIGVGPKLYSRLARFQAGLVYAGAGPEVDWAEAAVDLGYADQSHMIADFRQFSSLTPQMLASRRWFHPFIERARSRHGSLSGIRHRSSAVPTVHPNSRQGG
jgi:AraC-like DNA-binding protein